MYFTPCIFAFYETHFTIMRSRKMINQTVENTMVDISAALVLVARFEMAVRQNQQPVRNEVTAIANNQSSILSYS